MLHPKIIQGTPEIAVSTWSLARAVSKAGQLGVISGNALPVLLSRRLQKGDEGGHLRRTFQHFLVSAIARRAWEDYYLTGGLRPGRPFRLARQPVFGQGTAAVELAVLAAFAEVFLAREGHDGLVGMHMSGKLRLPLLPTLFGAMLAGVDYLVLSRFPEGLSAALDALREGAPASLPLEVEGANGSGKSYVCGFDPATIGFGDVPPLKRPALLAVVDTLEEIHDLRQLGAGSPDGYVWRGSVPAPLETLLDLQRPFWVCDLPTAANLQRLTQAGAAGLLVESAFTFALESGLDPILRQQVLDRCCDEPERVFVDLLPSPAGSPLSVLRLETTASDPTVFADRERICDVGYIRQPYRTPDGSVGYRCPGEPMRYFQEKGGDPAAGAPQRCICNGLLASVGLGQIQAGELEPVLVPAGEDVRCLTSFMPPGCRSYQAADVVRALLA